jgi:hypothetical protein
VTHAIKKLVHVNPLAALDPLALSIDLGVCLDCRNDGRCAHFHLSGSFDNMLQGCSNVSPPFYKQTEGVCVTVNRASVRKTVGFCDLNWAPPAEEVRFNLIALWMLAN